MYQLGEGYMNFLAELLPCGRGRSLGYNIKALFLSTRLINYTKVKKKILVSKFIASINYSGKQRT